MKEFVVVEFVQEGKVDVVHRSRIKEETNCIGCESYQTRRQTRWPPRDPARLAREAAAPTCHSRVHPVRILGSADNYLVARKRCRGAQFTSNLETDDNDMNEVGRPIRKRRPVPNITSSDEEELPSVKRPMGNRASRAGCDLPPAPLALSPVPLRGIDLGPPTASTSVLSPSRSQEDKALERMLLKQFAEMRLELRELKRDQQQNHTVLTMLLNTREQVPAQEHKMPTDLGLPLQTVQDVNTLEAKLDDSLQDTLDLEDKTKYFNDGRRKIDYILAYIEGAEDDDDDKKKERREEYERNLKYEGLELELAEKQLDEKIKVMFVKIHAPWAVLARYAEINSMKMPLTENDMEKETLSYLAKLHTPFDYDEALLPAVPNYFSAPFCRDRVTQDDSQYGCKFVVKDQDTYFTSAQRSFLTHQILSRAVFERSVEKGKDKLGIKKMLKSGIYSDAYPLHEGDYESADSPSKHPANDRHLLYYTWARPGAWYKFQPLDHIRLYFGEKIGIYFTWLGYYTVLLVPAALMGVIVFLYGVGTLFTDEIINQICKKSIFGNLTMCPLCDERCTYWRLSRSCLSSRLTHLFDNSATVFFAGFMALWAAVFHEMWKRRQAELEYDWDVAGFEEEETIRPEFEASVTRRRINKITQMEEPYIPMHIKGCYYCSSLVVVMFMLCIVIAALFGVIVYRITVVAVFYAFHQKDIAQRATILTSITAALINLVSIIILDIVYETIAQRLTNFESHRTLTEWEDSLTLKFFLFEFVNHYSSLIYIAFFKGRMNGRPGDYNRAILGKRQEECDPAGCLNELFIQLGIVMVGKQAFSSFKQLIFPKLMVMFRSWKVKETGKEKLTRWEEDYNLANMPDLGLFDEYLEMVIQFGFVTIFVAAFPLAPLFALINNIIEIRLDAYKFVTQWRRPYAARAQDIGIWSGILQGISTMAILSNAAIIAFTSEFIPRLVYRFGYSYDGSLSGYVNFSLSVFDVNDFENASIPNDPHYIEFGNVTYCRYRAYRNPPGGPDEYLLSPQYWHIVTGKLAFMITFLITVNFLTWLISFLIPDIPHGVRLQMLREKHLAREALLQMDALSLPRPKDGDEEAGEAEPEAKARY